MSHKDTLYAWLKENRPDVFTKVDAEGVTDLKALDILNQETGADVKSSDRMEAGSLRFLEAFRALPAPIN